MKWTDSATIDGGVGTVTITIIAAVYPIDRIKKSFIRFPQYQGIAP
jgi:hypothetical protein